MRRVGGERKLSRVLRVLTLGDRGRSGCMYACMQEQRGVKNAGPPCHPGRLCAPPAAPARSWAGAAPRWARAVGPRHPALQGERGGQEAHWACQGPAQLPWHSSRHSAAGQVLCTRVEALSSACAAALSLSLSVRTPTCLPSLLGKQVGGPEADQVLCGEAGGRQGGRVMSKGQGQQGGKHGAAATKARRVPPGAARLAVGSLAHLQLPGAQALLGGLPPHLAHHHVLEDQLGAGALRGARDKGRGSSFLVCRFGEDDPLHHHKNRLKSTPPPTCIMRSSTVLRATRRSTSTPRSWPSRCARAAACRSLCGFQSGRGGGRGGEGGGGMRAGV